MSLNDQFEYGRIPLKPLAYQNKDLAQCNEFIIDYGPNGDYHMYISDHNDPSVLIDLTTKIIKEILPNAKINANQFQIVIEGIEDPTSLQDILNFIYKRFTYPEDLNGFLYDRDIEKVMDPTTKSVLLQNTDGTYLLPITSASNVYDDTGKTIQERLNDITRVEFSTTYVKATADNQTEFEFNYPFENYSDYVMVHIGTTYIDESRYAITKDISIDGTWSKAKLTLIGNWDKIEKGRRIDILFIYNSVVKSNGEYSHIGGINITDASIPTSKLQKISDSFSLNDPTSVASSAAVYKLYEVMAEHLNSTFIGFNIEHTIATMNNQTVFAITPPVNINDVKAMMLFIGTVYVDESRYEISDYTGITTDSKRLVFTDGTTVEKNRRLDIIYLYDKGTGANIWATDTNPTAMDLINISISSDLPNLIDNRATSYFIANVILPIEKIPNQISVIYNGISRSYSIYTPDNSEIIRTYPANKTIRLFIDNISNTARLVSTNDISVSRFIYTCTGTGSSNVKWITTTKANIYREPNTNTKITELPALTEMICTSVGDGWYRITEILYTNNYANAVAGYIQAKLSNGTVQMEKKIDTDYGETIDQETIISFAGLEYSVGSIINVYRNGVRLFENLDYSMDAAAETIKLFVRTEEGERIIFEALTGITTMGY